MNQIAIRSHNLMFVLFGMTAFGVGLSTMLHHVVGVELFATFMMYISFVLLAAVIGLIVKKRKPQWVIYMFNLIVGCFLSLYIPAMFFNLGFGFWSVAISIIFLLACLDSFAKGSRLFFVRCDDER